jgi:hypothetical protein
MQCVCEEGEGATKTPKVFFFYCIKKVFLTKKRPVEGASCAPFFHCWPLQAPACDEVVHAQLQVQL